MKCLSWVGVIAGLTAAAAVAAPGIREPVRPVPGSPAEAVERLATAARAGDTDAFRARLAGRSRNEFDHRQASEKYQTALGDMFGFGPAGPPTWVRDRLAAVAARTYQVWAVHDRGEGRVDLTVWVTNPSAAGPGAIREETWVGLKDRAGWRLIPMDGGWLTEATRTAAGGRKVQVTVVDDLGRTGPSSPRADRLTADLVEMHTRTAAEVRAGKYPDRKAADQAYSDRMEAVHKRAGPDR